MACRIKHLLIAAAFFSLLWAQAIAAPIKATIDPTEMGVGARPFGMGKAYIGLADDTNSIFLNPSGLAFARSWQATSMYASLLGEINYTLVGYLHCMSSEAIGIGYLRADIGNSQIISYRDPATGRIVPTGEGAIGYMSSVLLLSYGGSVGKISRTDLLNDLYLGGSFKIFDQGLRGGTIEALALGLDLDLGLSWKALPWVRLAAFGQNVLPAGSGGVLRWTSGIEEDIPATYKLGAGLKLVGWDAPYSFYDQELYLGYDLEMSGKVGRPGINHLGLEWWPLEYLALRWGIDQDAVDTGSGIGVDNNLTAGVGLNYDGFQFDYAFHQFGALSENNTHFFSLSLNVLREKPPVKLAPAKAKYFMAVYPSAEAVIYGENLLITGEVEPEVELVSSGNVVARVLNNRFTLVLPIEKIGKNLVVLEASNTAGRKFDQTSIRVLRLPSFEDVEGDHWAHDAISMIAAIGLVQGYPGGIFKPDGRITRAELTTMLVRASGEKLPLVTEARLFGDVTANHWAAQYIKAGVTGGLVKGYPDKTFKPSNNINRAEGTVVIARFAGIEEPEAIYDKPYADLPISHWAIKTISAAKDAGILEYLGDGDFDAKNNLSRAEAVEMLAKTPFSKEKINNLLDFSSGY